MIVGVPASSCLSHIDFSFVFYLAFMYMYMLYEHVSNFASHSFIGVGNTWNGTANKQIKSH